MQPACSLDRMPLATQDLNGGRLGTGSEQITGEESTGDEGPSREAF